jgi:hypothetical protein
MFLKSSVAPKETPILDSERRVTRKWEESDGELAGCAALWKLDACHDERRARVIGAFFEVYIRVEYGTTR